MPKLFQIVVPEENLDDVMVVLKETGVVVSTCDSKTVRKMVTNQSPSFTATFSIWIPLTLFLCDFAIGTKDLSIIRWECIHADGSMRGYATV